MLELPTCTIRLSGYKCLSICFQEFSGASLVAGKETHCGKHFSTQAGRPFPGGQRWSRGSRLSFFLLCKPKRKKECSFPNSHTVSSGALISRPACGFCGQGVYIKSTESVRSAEGCFPEWQHRCCGGPCVRTTAAAACSFLHYSMG